MRLWHQALIPKLPRQQILGLHREICALRGNGWGRKHATVDYIFAYLPEHLVAYHYHVIGEMQRRRYKVDIKWCDSTYRGKNCDAYKNMDHELVTWLTSRPTPIYPEHNDEYLQECIDNLKGKGVEIDL